MNDQLTPDQLHRLEIVKLLTPYLMAIPQSKINSGSLVIYAKALKQFSIAEIEAAMLKQMRTLRYFPTIAEIFEQVEVMKDVIAGNETPSVDEAWHEVLQEIHDAFIYREPKFSTSEIARAALNMGWTTLCNLGINEMNTARAQFRDIYNGIIKRKKDKKVNTEILYALPDEKVQALLSKTTEKLKLVQGGVSS
jgi:uncharacterized protein YfkK (UPF0435 family)